jgi:hypothetical protein
MSSSAYEISFKLEGAYGALPAPRVARASDKVIAIPFEFSIGAEQIAKLRVAVFAHIFYPELSAEIGAALNNIPIEFDLFVSTDTEEKKAAIDRQFRGVGIRQYECRVFPNRGRDIAPFIVGFRREISNYDIVCHLHSKKSNHDDILHGWREYTFRQLCGSPAIVSSILYALQSGHVDILFPDHYGPVVQSLNYGFDYENMKEILTRAGIAFSKDILLEFPSGSMFWARSSALVPLLALNLRLDDFPVELGQVDGTLAHAIERCVLYLAERGGHRWAKVVQPADCAEANRLVPVCSSRDIPLAVTRATRRLLGNRVSTSVEPRLIPEIPAVGLRGERSRRPRFTLLIPTLKPEKIFGGVASALRLFNELLAKLPDAVDARIVSVTDDVDIECLAAVREYSQISLGAENTDLPRTVVDASGVKAEQLPVRAKEVFLATAWWTAYWGHEIRTMQRAIHGAAPPLYYFIQDHEPDFYGWSPRYALARSTYLYHDDTVAIINSEELFNFFTNHYAGFRTEYYVPYAVNKRLRDQFRSIPKERIIVVYARPGTPRNCFEILVDGLCLWQQADPIVARSWQIVAAGETFEPWLARRVANFDIVGKMTLSDYANILSRAAVGISLMMSPHPSYPPLEMAEAGVITVTNVHEGKDLSARSENIISIAILTAESLAQHVVEAVSRASMGIGKPGKFRDIAPIACRGAIFSASTVARSIESALSGQPERVV